MRIVVAGVAGGTGTTTVAVLLARLVGRERSATPVLVDHGGGTLAARFGAEEPWAGRPLEVADLGPLTATERWESFVAEGHVPVLTASMTPAGIDVLAEAVDTLARHAPRALARTVLVATGTGAGDRGWIGLGRGAAAATARHVLPRDPSLALGGVVRMDEMGGAARRAATLMAAETAGRLGD